MKVKNLILVILSVVIFGCSTEENTINTTEANLEMNIKKATTSNSGEDQARSTFPCTLLPSCDPDYEFPTMVSAPGFETRLITYDADQTLEEIHCLRQRFFDCFSELRMNLFQPPSDHQDSWIYPVFIPGPKTGKVLDGSINDDERVCSANC